MSSSRPTFWCVNFNTDDALCHGIERQCWMMQHQYSHAGYDYQGNQKQKSMVTQAWGAVRGVSIDDWLLAYLSPKTFYAVGRVIAPRRTARNSDAALTDTVARTIKEKGHKYQEGIVTYTDAPAFYEDFNDTWKTPTDPLGGRQPRYFSYAQRIDVERWLHFMEDGVVLDGMAAAVHGLDYRRPLFQISQNFFNEVSKALQEFAG